MSNSAGIWWIPILVAIVTGFATVITVYLTGRANLRLEREKFHTNSLLERQKFESNLVLQAIPTGDEEAARRNLHFLVQAGFLHDPHGRIKALTDEPEETPVLPAWILTEPAPQRGTFRRDVRTGTDPDASLVNSTPVRTSVEDLIAQPRPADMPDNPMIGAYQDHRADPVERNVYQLEADIVWCKLMINGDYRLNLQGATGQTMLARCPDPRLVDPNGRWAKQIAAVRSQIYQRLEPGIAPKEYQNERARVTGVGFFNFSAGRVGAAPNGVELTPVLDVEWLSGPKGPQYQSPGATALTAERRRRRSRTASSTAST